MSAAIFEGMAEVFMAGARHARGWNYNLDRQQDAEILEAQAKQALKVAASFSEDDNYRPVWSSVPDLELYRGYFLQRIYKLWSVFNADTAQFHGQFDTIERARSQVNLVIAGHDGP